MAVEREESAAAEAWTSGLPSSPHRRASTRLECSPAACSLRCHQTLSLTAPLPSHTSLCYAVPAFAPGCSEQLRA